MSNASVQQDARRILIVDDHPIVRQGMRLMIDAEPDLQICGEAQTEQEARRQVRALMPDAMVVDLSLEEGDGFNVVRDVHAHFPQIRILVLSMHDELIYAQRLLAEGAAGYIMKQAAAAQLINALRAVLRGERYVSEALQQNLGTRSELDGGGSTRLSTRELQVISLIGRGLGHAADRRQPFTFREDSRDASPDHQAQAGARYQCATGAVRDQMARHARRLITWIGGSCLCAGVAGCVGGACPGVVCRPQRLARTHCTVSEQLTGSPGAPGRRPALEYRLEHRHRQR